MGIDRLAAKEAVNNTSYNVYYQKKDSNEFNGIKTRLVNTITAEG